MFRIVMSLLIILGAAGIALKGELYAASTAEIEVQRLQNQLDILKRSTLNNCKRVARSVKTTSKIPTVISTCPRNKKAIHVSCDFKGPASRGIALAKTNVSKGAAVCTWNNPQSVGTSWTTTAICCDGGYGL